MKIGDTFMLLGKIIIISTIYYSTNDVEILHIDKKGQIQKTIVDDGLIKTLTEA